MTTDELRDKSPLFLLALWVSVGFWGVLMGAFRDADPYVALGAYAALILLAAGTYFRAALVAWLAPHTQAITTGVVLGAVMVALTYPAFDLATTWVPALKPQVASLYGVSARPDLLGVLPSLLVIITAEEVLWRGVLLEAFHERPLLGMAISIASYTLAQACTGSIVVGLLALVCGTVWTVQRRVTGSLLSPLISHLIWTPVVLVFFPVL